MMLSEFVRWVGVDDSGCMPLSLSYSARTAWLVPWAMASRAWGLVRTLAWPGGTSW